MSAALSYLMTLSAGWTAQAPAADSWWDRWRGIAGEPALVEAILLFAFGLLLLLVTMRWSRMVREVHGRAAVSDYLLGVEQALAGDLLGAVKRLRKVIAEDPENHHARLLLGESLAQLGEQAEAHMHHLVLQKAFKLESGRNDLALARNLLDLGRNAEAVSAAQRVVADQPDQLAGLRLLFQAQLAAGYPEDAGRTGAQLARRLPEGNDRARILERAGAALALAGKVRLTAGELVGAQALAREAAALSPDSPEVRGLLAHAALVARGKDGMLELLRAPSEGEAQQGSALPVVSDNSATVFAPSTVTALVGLAPRGAYACKVCGGALVRAEAVCPHCGARAASERTEPALFDDLESPGLVLDEVEESRAYVRRLVEAASFGDEIAATDLIEMGETAVDEVLATAMRKGPTQDALISVLQRMGAGIVRPLFDSYERLKQGGLLKLPVLGLGPSPRVLGRVVQGFGREALPHFEGLLGTVDRDLRKVLIDFYIGLGDQTEFQKVLDRLPPVEVIHRLNDAPAELLVRLLSTVEASSFLADVLLLEPIFLRDAELFLATAHAVAPQTLVAVITRRAYNAALIKLVIEHLVDERLAGPAGQILDAFAADALDHLVSAFSDLDRPAELRRTLEQRIASMGTAGVSTICSFFGPAPASVDSDLQRVLVAIGAPAIDELAEAFAKSGLFERLGSGLVSRYTHRRAMMVQALTALGAESTLRRLRERESDANLKLRLSQALQRLRGERTPDAGDSEQQRQGGGRGQVG